MTELAPGEAARKAFRGPASAALSLEIVIVPLALLVMDKVEGGLTPAEDRLGGRADRRDDRRDRPVLDARGGCRWPWACRC